MTTQKTWTEFLGSDAMDCKVDGKYIVQHMGENRYKIRYMSDSEAMAKQILAIWKAE